MSTAMFLVGNELVATFELPLPPERTHGALAYFCSHCGEVWARLIVVGQQFYPCYSACPKHGGGSLYHDLAVSDIKQYFPHDFWLFELRRLVRRGDL